MTAERVTTIKRCFRNSTNATFIQNASEICRRTDKGKEIRTVLSVRPCSSAPADSCLGIIRESNIQILEV